MHQFELRATELSLTLPNHRKLFSGLSFNASSGKSLAVTGPSGVGKSSLLRVVGSLIVPSEGTVTLSDDSGTRPVNRLDATWIFQDNWCLEERTLYDNVAQALGPTGMKFRVEQEQVRAALLMVGLEGLSGAKARRLSGGERQRMCVARAVVAPSPILLADEPTAHLDAANSVLVGRCVEAACEVGKVILLATHDPQMAELCDARISL